MCGFGFPGVGRQGNRMNVVRINSSPFKGEVGRGMGLPGGYFVDQTAVRAHPHPIPPLEGEGERVHAIALRWPFFNRLA